MMSTYRDYFFLPDDLIFLNCAYMSPMLRTVEDAGIAGIRKKRNPSLLTPGDFFEPLEVIRKLFAQLLHIRDTNRIVLAPSVSYGLANVANNLVLKPNDNVVVLSEQFPSNYYVWYELCKKHKAHLRTVPPSRLDDQPARAWNDAILKMIDSNTRVVAIPHVHWTDGTLFDLKSIREKTRENNCLLIIDGTQSFGAFPFDNTSIDADVLVCSAYKWLMGPYGSALCYYSSYFDQGQPIEHSWMNRQNSHDFANLIDYQATFRSGAKRYEVGESSNFIHLPMIQAALEQVIAWGPDRIQGHCSSISKMALEQLSAAGFVINQVNPRAHHLFGIRLPDRLSMADVSKSLLDARIYISIRGNAIRVAPHCYNSEDDLLELSRVLRSCLD